jgi:hypothetical protein
MSKTSSKAAPPARGDSQADMAWQFVKILRRLNASPSAIEAAEEEARRLEQQEKEPEARPRKRAVG